MSLARRSPLALAAMAVALALSLTPAAPASAAPPPPSSMTSMGDSISRGFNACGFFVDCPSRSFGTGSVAGLNSHYQRIRAANAAMDGHNYNVARSGAKAADMPAQASAAVARGVQYVTLLIGANDACTGSEATMTPVTTFRGHIDTALARLRAGLPGARVYVVSIPDIRRLWEVGRGNASARSAWSLFGICKTMLARPTSTAQGDLDRRARVRQRVIEFNAQLAQACAAYGPNCRFDGNAVFGYQFTLAQMSTWDYFHPNPSGQAVLARVSYAAGWGW